MAIRAALRFAVLALALIYGTMAIGENIDPDDDGSQYAFSENEGWINGEPAGNGGPGMQVNDFEVTGFLWGENIGWINLSDRNPSTNTSPRSFGVLNDGSGVLTGFAWGENLGWVSFSCENTDSCDRVSYGVTIDPATGDFSGRGWSENKGWITFASEGPHPYKMKTGWTCEPPPPPPPGTPRLLMGRSGPTTTLIWNGIPGATGFDVISGSLDELVSTGGDFAVATKRCLVNKQVALSLSVAVNAVEPGNEWFLVRGVNCGASGSYDTGGSGQTGLRDAEIMASGNGCP